MSNWDLSDNSPFEGIVLQGNPIAWEQLKSVLPLGEVLTGKIFFRAPFGVFFDSGHGFPVLVRVPDFGIIKPGGMIFPDDYPDLGSEISGKFCGFDDRNRQLVTCRLDYKFD